jgi:hypothetical protein
MTFQNRVVGCAITNGRDPKMGIPKNSPRIGLGGELKERDIGHRHPSEVEEGGL